MALILYASLVSSAYAVDNAANRLQSRAAQEQTIRALQLINQDQWTLGRDVVAQTRDPLASKLYYWLSFTRRNSVENYGYLAQFIRGNPDWPGIETLKRKAEEQMPASLRADEVLGWYNDNPPKTATGVMRYVQALLNSGRQVEAKKFLSDWWATTSLSRDDQRKIFRAYGQYLDRAAHLRRFDRMLLRGQNDNARALADVLGQGYPELAEARIGLAASAGNVNALINSVPANLQNDPGLLYERLHWRRENDANDGAIEILKNTPPADKILNPEEWWRERHIIIRRLIEKRDYKTAYDLARKHVQTPGSFEYSQAEWVSGWLALRFINSPTKALEHFEALYENVKTPISLSRGAYWAGRASQGFSDKKISKTWFEIAAKHSTTFYGQLAGAEMGIKEALPHAAAPVLSSADIEMFKSRELVQAAMLFNRAGMRRESADFLKAFADSEGSAKAYRYAADLALENDRTDLAVKISKEATNKGLFLTAQSYPVISKYMNGIDLEWALIHAVIRQESVFDTQAQSPAGALGLMQLMPATAKETAGKMGIPHSTTSLTSNPRHNIMLGSTYLAKMVRRYDGAYPLAIAAYNAGPGRVDKWLQIYGDPRKNEIDWIDWIEIIPIYETRNYVQRVMEGIYVYRLRLKDIQKPSPLPIHVALISRSNG